MKIGFISILGERGQWHVTKNFMNALQQEHELYLLARPFHVRDGVFIGDIKNYDIKAQVTKSSTYQLRPEFVENWVKINKLDVVVFNEEYNWDLIDACNKHAKTVTYLDYFTKQQMPLFEKYDLIIACAMHAYNAFKDRGFQNIKFIDWGVDDKLFKPIIPRKTICRYYDGQGCKSNPAGKIDTTIEKCCVMCQARIKMNEQHESYQYNIKTHRTTFFHSAGWGGINWRKCSPDVLRTFDSIRKKGHDFTMTFHSQTAKCHYPIDCQAIIDKYEAEGVLITHWGTIAHPGLYHTGIINVAPSILEGLGLFLPEGLSCGMPTITTNAAPMNQFVKNNVNGLLIEIAGSHYRTDPYYFPEYDIDVNSLEEMMITLGSDPNMQQRLSEKAREGIESTNALAIFNRNVLNLFKELK